MKRISFAALFYFEWRASKYSIRGIRKENSLIIDSYAIGMESNRTFMSVSKEARSFSLGAESAEQAQAGFADFITYTEDKDGTVIVPIKAEDNKSTADSLGETIESMKQVSAVRVNRLWEQTFKSEVKNRTLDYLIRLLYGDRIPAELKDRLTDTNVTGGQQAAPAISGIDAGSVIGLSTVTTYHYIEEQESTAFKTTGTVNTADGRSISFDVEAEMSRSLIECTGININETFRLTDPLVINLDGNVANVESQKFYFDLNSDGEQEEMSMLAKGSGFLAIDLNDDGIINDGSELFGTKSGNGFEDLKKYDLDGNGWIDEADRVYGLLKVWTQGDDGNMKLIDLKEAGVGAMFLGNSDTEFSLKNAAGITDAVIRKTGLFLFEDGRSGTLQQVDMAVS